MGWVDNWQRERAVCYEGVDEVGARVGRFDVRLVPGVGKYDDLRLRGQRCIRCNGGPEKVVAGRLDDGPRGLDNCSSLRTRPLPIR